MLENVLDAIRGSAPLAAPGRDGAAAIALIDAIRRSIDSGAELDFSSEEPVQ